MVWTCEDDWPPKRTSTYKRPFTQEGNYLVLVAPYSIIKVLVWSCTCPLCFHWCQFMKWFTCFYCCWWEFAYIVHDAKEWLYVFLHFEGLHFYQCTQFIRLWSTSCLGIISLKNGMLYTRNWLLFNLRFSFSQICSHMLSVQSWVMFSAILSWPTTEMSSAILNTFGSSLKISSVFSGTFLQMVLL